MYCTASRKGINMDIRKYEIIQSALKFSKIISNRYFVVMLHNSHVIYINDIFKRETKTILISGDGEINIYNSAIYNNDYTSLFYKHSFDILDLFFISDFYIVIVVKDGYYLINVESDSIKFNNFIYQETYEVVDFVHLYNNRGLFLLNTNKDSEIEYKVVKIDFFNFKKIYKSLDIKTEIELKRICVDFKNEVLGVFGYDTEEWVNVSLYDLNLSNKISQFLIEEDNFQKSIIYMIDKKLIFKYNVNEYGKEEEHVHFLSI